MNCKLCGKEIEAGYKNGPQAEIMKNKDYCFSCAFWENLSQEKIDRIIIEGEHYVVVSENNLEENKGFGGRKHTILMDDGRTIVTTNLWHQGPIPEHFRKQLPNNAKWA